MFFSFLIVYFFPHSCSFPHITYFSPPHKTIYDGSGVLYPSEVLPDSHLAGTGRETNAERRRREIGYRRKEERRRGGERGKKREERRRGEMRRREDEEGGREEQKEEREKRHSYCVRCVLCAVLLCVNVLRTVYCVNVLCTYYLHIRRFLRPLPVLLPVLHYPLSRYSFILSFFLLSYYHGLSPSFFPFPFPYTGKGKIVQEVEEKHDSDYSGVKGS